MFKPEKREIYRYWNGTKEILADPRKILNAFLEYSGDSTLEHDFKLLLVTDPKEQLPAYERIITSARRAFNLAELGQNEAGEVVGVTNDEVMGIFLDFGQYVDNVKKNTPETPSLPPSTESASSNGAMKHPTMSAILGSGSAVSVPSIDVASPPTLARLPS